ncbi:MAG TPA: ATP-binding cassette domain-containing protein [Anaerolineae bacterium]|nr:ATP-binding cassette domain-containing protein [Anaerolineae bacterium]
MIELRELQKVIDQNTQIDIRELTIKAGEIAALVGPIDSGKEILLELLTGQSRPTAGEVRLAGFDPHTERDRFGHEVGILFAEENLYPRMTVEGNLKFYGRLRRLPKARVMEIINTVGLADHANVKVEKLPSSLLRRLSFGRAILHDPKALLLAEPFAKCDDTSVSLLSGLMSQLAADGVAILILAEETTNLEPVCDMIYRLEKGRIVDEYSPSEERRADLPFMIPAKQEGKVDLVDPADILYVVAQEDRAYLQTASDLLPTQFTLTELEKRLSRSGFFRAHRSYLVNLQHVKEVIPFTRDSFTLRLKDEAGTQIPLSKSAARELRELLGY